MPDRIYTNSELNEIAEIVNEGISTLTHLRATKNHFVPKERKGMIYFNRDNSSDLFSKQVFGSLVKCQKQVRKTHFHYKGFEIAYDFLEGDFITASALSNFKRSTDDLKEYEHFFSITKIPASDDYIQKLKDDFFIFCLTEDNNTPRFWQEYTKNEGLCLEIEFEIKPDSDDFFDLRKVHYDDGGTFTFYPQMQNKIFNKFGAYLLTDGLSKFAAFYKRKTEYEWERETRLFLNWKYQSALKSKRLSLIEKDGRRFLKIPFDNDLFSIKILSVKLGNELLRNEPDKVARITDLCRKKGYRIV